MVCRSTHIGSAMTSYVKILEGVREYQSLSLYHEIIREGRPTFPPVNEEEKRAFVDNMIIKVQSSQNFTEARKRSLIERLHAARDAHVTADIMYATKRIEARATSARNALADYYNRTAREMGQSIGQVQNRLDASYEESKRERNMVAPEEWTREFLARPENRNLPPDRHTMYAMWRIDNEIAERGAATESRPVVTNHQRVNGAGLSRVGYDPETGRLECEMRSRQGTFYAYRNVPQSVATQLLSSENPTRDFNRLIRNNPDYAYADADAANAAGVSRRCASCGQWANEAHGCPSFGSSDELAATVSRARIQQQVMRARAAAASGTDEERLHRYAAVEGVSYNMAQERVARENALASMSPDTTLRHRQRQPLSARIYPYHGEAGGTFRCTALSTVRQILEEERDTNVPVVAVVTHVAGPDGRPAPVPEGRVEGRVIFATDTNGAYTVTPATTPGDSGEDQLRCNCPEYARNYDCVHVRQLVGDMTRRINQNILSARHTVSDQIQATMAAAQADHAANQQAAQVAAAVWTQRAADYEYTGEQGAAVFQEDYAAAKARSDAGEQVVPYFTENATDGLGAPGTGRTFGFEMEFEFPSGVDRYAALQSIGREMHAAGLITSPTQRHYHSGSYSTSHQGGWRFENDCSVNGGEIVTPIMSDTPETWENVAKVCDILKRHGAIVNGKTGGHINIGTADFSGNPATYGRLAHMVREQEDVVYRLGANDETGVHRGRRSNGYIGSSPAVPASGYSDMRSVMYNNMRGGALNMAHATGNSQRVEVRAMDGSLDPAVWQARLNYMLGMVERAKTETTYTPGPHQRVGTQRTFNQQNRNENGRLTADAWRQSTNGLRDGIQKGVKRRDIAAQVTALFYKTKQWQGSM